MIRKTAIALFVILISSMLYADSIRTRDGKVLNVKIKDITAGEIKFIPDGAGGIKSISRCEVVGISYSDGSSYDFYDQVYLKSGGVLRGFVIQMTGDRIEYDPEGPRPFDIVLIKDASKIEYVCKGTQILHEEQAAAPVEKKMQASSDISEESGPFHYEDDKFNYYINARIGYDIISNKTGPKLSREIANGYLSYLNSADSQYNDYEVDDKTAGQDVSLGMMMEIDGRVMSDLGPGIGLGLGAASVPDSAPTTIKTGEGTDAYTVSIGQNYVFFDLTLYYKYFFLTDKSFAPYALIGLGAGSHYARFYSWVRSTGDGDPPGGKQFEKDYISTAIGYHGLFEVGIERSFFSLYAGVKISGANFSEFETDAKVVRYENGEKLSADVVHTMIYFGGSLFL